MAVPALPFDAQALQQWDQPRVSIKRAHDLLSRVRDQLTQNREERVDLSSSDLLWGYLCGRPDAAIIVGPGITDLYAMRLGIRDSNTHQMRVDFVAMHTDNAAARFHPSGNSHGKAIVGDWRQWLLPDSALGIAPAETRGSVVVTGGGGEAFEGRHQADVIGRDVAKEFLQYAVRSWGERPHPRPNFYDNLYDGRRFPWWLYLNSTPWGRDLAPRVTAFYVCWLNNPYDRAGFHVIAGQGEEYIIDVSGNRRIPLIDLLTVHDGTVSMM